MNRINLCPELERERDFVRSTSRCQDRLLRHKSRKSKDQGNA